MIMFHHIGRQCNTTAMPLITIHPTRQRPAHRSQMQINPFPEDLAVISHRQPGPLDIRKSHTARLLQTPDAHAVAHLRRAREAIDDLALRAGERDRADLAVVAVEEVHLAVSGAGDGVAGGEVGAESAAPGAGGDGEGDGVVLLVGCAGGLRDAVVDGKADGFGVGDGAGFGGQMGGCGGEGAGEGEGAEDGGGEGEVLHGCVWWWCSGEVVGREY